VLKKADKQKQRRRPKQGRVVKKSGDKSILIEVVRREKHPMYGKIIKKRKKFMVHDEENKAQIGDAVTFIESRPISKKKRWKLLSISRVRNS